MRHLRQTDQGPALDQRVLLRPLSRCCPPGRVAILDRKCPKVDRNCPPKPSDAGRLLAPDHGGDELLAIRAGGLSGVNVTRVNEFPGRDLVFAWPASAAACASTSEIRPIADTCNSAYRSR